MLYYDTIRNPSTFRAAASAEQAENFDALFGGGCPTAVSHWGRKQLFASRLTCNEPGTSLPLLDGHHPDLANLDPCIRHLITGYGSAVDLAKLQEPQIVRLYDPDSLGYVWAALAAFLRGDESSSVTTAADRPQRGRRPPPEHAQYIASNSFQIGSSSPTRPDSSDGSESSIGFAKALSAPLLEEATIRLASCFIRCVLNYGQPLDKNSPFVHFRDERQTYNYSARRAPRLVEAIDDGGLQLFNGKRTFQVALLEGKRSFQTVIEGKPVVSDELLAQLVGEALSLKRHARIRNISEDDIVSILAVTHYIKFFHFHISDDFIEEYEGLAPANTHSAESHITAHSTKWYDVKIPNHREHLSSLLLALVAWAGYERERQGLNLDMED